MPTETQILRNRAAADRALARPDLRAARAAIQQAYAAAQEAARDAAAHHRFLDGRADPLGLGRIEGRIVEADSHADALAARYQALFDAYHGPDGLRARALAEEGYDPTLDLLTDAEQQQQAAQERVLLAYPPVGWGSSLPAAERVTRWQARPAAERLRDPRPRA